MNISRCFYKKKKKKWLDRNQALNRVMLLVYDKLHGPSAPNIPKGSHRLHHLRLPLVAIPALPSFLFPFFPGEIDPPLRQKNISRHKTPPKSVGIHMQIPTL